MVYDLRNKPMVSIATEELKYERWHLPPLLVTLPVLNEVWALGTMNQGLRASSLQFTSPLEFNAIFRDGFTLRHELTAGSEIRDPVPAKFKHVTNIVTCTSTMLWLRHVVPALKFPKSWLRTLGYRQKIHHFFFSHKWGTRFKYLSKLCPYILMYSALHIMQWFSAFRCVHPENQTKIFRFSHFMNQNKCRLHKTWDDR